MDIKLIHVPDSESPAQDANFGQRFCAGLDPALVQYDGHEI